MASTGTLPFLQPRSPTPLSFCFLQIDYFNNQVIVDLVEQQHKGIIAILDDACMNVGKVTDEMFLDALNTKLGKHAHFSSRKVSPRPCCPCRPFSTFLAGTEQGNGAGWIGITAAECEMQSPEQLQPQRKPAEGAPAWAVAHPFIRDKRSLSSCLDIS